MQCFGQRLVYVYTKVETAVTGFACQLVFEVVFGIFQYDVDPVMFFIRYTLDELW